MQPTPGAAPTSGAPTPPPSGAPAVDPTIADPGDLTSATGRFQGTATPGHRVRVIDPAVTSRSVCTATTESDGTWTCSGPVATGPQQVFTVQDLSDASRRTADAPAADVVVPPVISTREPTTGTVVGTGDVGTTVTVSVSGSSAVRTAAVGSDGRWIVSWSTGAAPRPSGTVTMTATATASTADGFRSDLRSAASAPATVTFDRTPPDAPTVTSPRTGDRVAAQALVVRGTGEPRAVLTVYVDRAPVCGATVRADGSWACSTSGGPLTVGAHVVTALQHDAAGNHSPSSTPVTVDVAATTPGSTASPSGSPGSGSATGGSSGPATGGTGGPTTGTGPGSGGPGSSAGGTTDGTGTGTGPTPMRPGARQRAAGREWTGPARPGTGPWRRRSVAPSRRSRRRPRGTRSRSRAPSRSGSCCWSPDPRVSSHGPCADGSRCGWARSPVATAPGRNGGAATTPCPAWASVSIAVVLASVLTLLGVGVSLEARYVRLAIAVLLGTGVLAAAVVLATRWAAGADRHTVGFRVSPWLVLAALVACAVTRAADLSPALVLGVLLVPVGRTDVDTGAMRLGAGVAACARSATWRSCALLVLAATGWLLHSVTTGPGFWTALVSEFAITLCVGGLGSLVATLLPLAGSAGSALWSRSRTRYAAVATVGVALGAAVYSGPGGTHVSPVALALIACVCVAAALGTWLWVRTADADSARA